MTIVTVEKWICDGCKTLVYCDCNAKPKGWIWGHLITTNDNNDKKYLAVCDKCRSVATFDNVLRKIKQ